MSVEHPSIRFMFEILKITGVIDYHVKENDKPLKNKIATIYTRFVHTMLMLYLILHFMSTVTRSLRNFSEFFQSLFEDFVFLLLYCRINLVCREENKLKEVVTLMETFSTVDVKIIEKCNRKARIIFTLYSTSIMLALVGLILAACYPITIQHDLELQHLQNPHRKLPTNILIPFIDETSSTYYEYEIVFLFQTYVLIVFLSSACVSMSLLPMLIAHVEGQYKILCYYIQQIGKVHYDGYNNVIYYTNIETKEYVLFQRVKNRKLRIRPHIAVQQIAWEKVKTEDEVLKNSNGKVKTALTAKFVVKHKINMTTVLEVQHDNITLPSSEEYDSAYVRQIIQFHKRLIIFQSKVGKYVPICYVELRRG
jgi:7tm Odorant receptor.